MNMGIPVQELMAQIEQHLPIETTSAKMKADEIREIIYASFFKTLSIRGLCFVDQDHEEMVFENSWMRDRPAGIEFFRVWSTVDPRAIHAYIKEPGFTAKFDLALAQTHLVTPFLATAAENPDHAKPRNLFGSPSLQAASPYLACCIAQYHGDDMSLVVNSYHGRLDFLDLQANFDEVYPNPVQIDPYAPDAPSVLVNMKAFASQCGLYAFLRTLREYYVGTVDNLSFEAICGIGETLRAYSMEYTVYRKMYTATPDTLYGKYLSLTYLLPDDPRQWGFTLYDIFVNALTEKIWKGVNKSKTYIRPDFTRIITRSQQYDALVLLKNESHRVNEALKEQEEMFKYHHY
jgi:hypothetical protein